MHNARYFSPKVPARRKDFKDQAKIIIGSALYPIQTYRWLQFLKTHPVLKDLAATLPHLISKIHKPYLSTRFNCAERVDLLIGHYQFAFNARFGNLIKKTAIHPITICEFTGKSGSLYQLTLSSMDTHHREGELVLRLMSKDVCVYVITFIFISLNGEYHVKIGGLYGLLATDNRIGIKQVTRDLYGCRPKDLMVSIVREVGACVGCNKALLISNSNKIPNKRKYFCKKSSDYDLTWKELNATRGEDGNFELPCTRHNLCQAIFPRKRSEILVDAVLAAIRSRLNKERTSKRYIFPSFAVGSQLTSVATEAKREPSNETMRLVANQFTR
jgi:uncharacterized protein VirK/YbjX